MKPATERRVKAIMAAAQILREEGPRDLEAAARGLLRQDAELEGVALSTLLLEIREPGALRMLIDRVEEGFDEAVVEHAFDIAEEATPYVRTATGLQTITGALFATANLMPLTIDRMAKHHARGGQPEAKVFFEALLNLRDAYEALTAVQDMDDTTKGERIN